MKKGWVFLWRYPFFGLVHDREYLANLYSSLFELCYYSQGGISITEAIEMPIALRHFFRNKILDIHKKQEEYQKTQENLVKNKR